MDRRSVFFEKGREMDRVGRLAALGAYKPLLIVTLHLELHFLTPSGPDRSTCLLWAASCILCLTMVFIDMDSLQFYEPPAKPGVRSNGRPTTSNLRIPSPRWEDPVALGASQKSSGVLYNPNLTQSQNGTGPLQKDSLDSFHAPEMGLNGTQADQEIASIPNEGANTSWDNMIPLSCRRASERTYRPCFQPPPGTFCKTSVLERPAAGESAGG